MKKLYRSRTDRQLAGVCGGLAEYLGVDSTFIRLILAFLIICAGTGLLLYVLAAIIIPSEPY